MSAKIVKVEYYLPETVITNNDLAKEFQNGHQIRLRRK